MDTKLTLKLDQEIIEKLNIMRLKKIKLISNYRKLP
jgi:hypothetical protein